MSIFMQIFYILTCSVQCIHHSNLNYYPCICPFRIICNKIAISLVQCVLFQSNLWGYKIKIPAQIRGRSQFIAASHKTPWSAHCSCFPSSSSPPCLSLCPRRLPQSPPLPPPQVRRKEPRTSRYIFLTTKTKTSTLLSLWPLPSRLKYFMPLINFV